MDSDFIDTLEFLFLILINNYKNIMHLSFYPIHDSYNSLLRLHQSVNHEPRFQSLSFKKQTWAYKLSPLQHFQCRKQFLFFINNYKNIMHLSTQYMILYNSLVRLHQSVNHEPRFQSLSFKILSRNRLGLINCPHCSIFNAECNSYSSTVFLD